jgi:hypothetical protein
VLAATGLSRAPLSALLAPDGRDFDHERVEQLLEVMKSETKPVTPKVLGLIGRTHLATRFEQLGIRKGSFDYKKVAGLGEDGLPQVTEVAFAALEAENEERMLITGVNWVGCLGQPIPDTGRLRPQPRHLADRAEVLGRPADRAARSRRPPARPVRRPRQVDGRDAMRGEDITRALGDVGQKWTRQVKAEERSSSARVYRQSMWTVSRTSLKEICEEHMEEAWNKASDNGRLPTHWRQIFYVMRPICDAHPDSDRPLRDATFKNILEQYLEDYGPGWDVLRGARGVFKEPHAALNDNGLPMSTMNVRTYLQAERPSSKLAPIAARFPTRGARNRIAAILICEKEGFDELLCAERVPERFDLALMSTKGISAIAARDLARDLDVPCFTLHDMDKNGFVMAAGFPFATDIGIRMEDVEDWNLAPEDQHHRNPDKTRWNLLHN